MRIVSLLVRHGTQRYPGAAEALREWFARRLPAAAHELLVIDNALPPGHCEPLAGGGHAIGGENAHWEFSAWDRAVAQLGARLEQFDWVQLATSAFRMFEPAHLERIDAGLLAALQGRAAALGHIDYGGESLQLGPRSAQSWLRSSFVFLPPLELRWLGSLVGVADRAALFSGDPRAPFREDGALSPSYRRFLLGWLTGPGTGQGVTWHSRFELGPETLAHFEAKAMAILNEHALSARLRAQGCALVDVSWLATHRARLRGRAPLGPIPDWRQQLARRGTDRRPLVSS